MGTQDWNRAHPLGNGTNAPVLGYETFCFRLTEKLGGLAGKVVAQRLDELGFEPLDFRLVANLLSLKPKFLRLQPNSPRLQSEKFFFEAGELQFEPMRLNFQPLRVRFKPKLYRVKG